MGRRQRGHVVNTHAQKSTNTDASLTLRKKEKTWPTNFANMLKATI